MKSFDIRRTFNDFYKMKQIEETDATIQNWQELAFHFILNISVLIGLVLVPVYAASAIPRGDWKGLIFAAIAWLNVLLCRFVISPKSHKLRVVIFLVTVYFMIISLGVSKTLVGDARVWIVFMVVVTEVLLGGKISLAILVITSLSWYGLGILFKYEILNYPLAHLTKLIAPDALFTWLNTSVSLFGLGAILIISIRAVTKNLNKSLKYSRALTENLRKEAEERKQVERNLKGSEKKYRRLFENSPLLLMEIDKAYNIIAINPAMAKSIDSDLETLVGISVIDLLPEEIVQARSKQIERALSNNETIQFDDERDGKYFHNIFVPSPDGETLQVISQDITEQVQDRQKILKYQEHLNDLVKQRTDDLLREVESRKQVEQKAMKAQKMADIGLLAAGIAHELNSPLQSSLNNSDYLLRKYSDTVEDSPILRDKLNNIKRDILRCGKIVHSLQNYAHTSSHEYSVSDIGELVKSTLLLTKHQFKNYNNVYIKTEIEDDMPPFLCDQDHIMQTLINLLTNARDAMPEGGQITIQSNYSSDNGQFMLRVIDTGTGISEEDIKHIFTPFFTTKQVGKGTGLGLYIVHGYVQSRGGIIDVKSTIGKGTVITITYPEKPPSMP